MEGSYTPGGDSVDTVDTAASRKETGCKGRLYTNTYLFLKLKRVMNISVTEVSTVGYENLPIFGNGYRCQRLSTVPLWIKALINKECYAVNAVNP